MNPADAEQFLAQSIADHKLSGSEKQALTDWLAAHAANDQARGVIRHIAFELARREVTDPAAATVIGWLEAVMKVVVPIRPPHEEGHRGGSVAFFAPGPACWQHIDRRLNEARHSADLCVFTITDDRISRAVLAAHARGVRVRVLSDEMKADDLGSDVRQFAAAGIAVKLTTPIGRQGHGDPGHMHHKFALFDGHRLLGGSYNWTRGAADVNYENLIDTTDPDLVAAFGGEFERLWSRF
jgi:phosphatidylserine/phosphatidylglycerophosphate/cardiolipin synthase-like enzyme